LGDREEGSQIGLEPESQRVLRGRLNCARPTAPGVPNSSDFWGSFRFSVPVSFWLCYLKLSLWRCSLCQPVGSVWRASGAAGSQCAKAQWPRLEIGRVPVSRRAVQSHPTTKRPLITSERHPARRLLENITRKGRPACKTNFPRICRFLSASRARFGWHAKTCQVGQAQRAEIYFGGSVFASCDVRSVSRQIRCGERAERLGVSVRKRSGPGWKSDACRFLGGQCSRMGDESGGPET
jgi:hypothetical protein